MSNRGLFLWVVLATLVTAALYLWGWYGVSVGDTFVMRRAHLIPASDTWSYWVELFSHPHHGPQYRPVGFFVYFWVMGKLFASSHWSLALASYGLFAWSLAELLLLGRRMNWGTLSLILMTSVMLLHPVTANIMDQSFAMKYQFTLAVLVHGLRMLLEPRIPAYRWGLLFVLGVLAGLSQEGTIVFPFIWLLWDICLHKKFRWPHLAYLGLVVLYFVARTFYLPARPATGFMQVSWAYLPTGLSYYLHIIFSPLIGMFHFSQHEVTPFNALWIIAPGAFLVFGILALMRRRWLPMFCGMAAFALVFPYSLLVNHMNYDRAYWGLAPAALLLGFIAQHLNAGWRYLLLFFVVTLGASQYVHRPTVVSYANNMRSLQTKTRELATKINPRPGETIAIYFESPIAVDHWLNENLPAGELAHLAQGSTIFLFSNHARRNGTQVIKDGVKYFIFMYDKSHRIAGQHYATAYGIDKFQNLHSFYMKIDWDREFHVPVFFPPGGVQ